MTPVIPASEKNQPCPPLVVKRYSQTATGVPSFLVLRIVTKIKNQIKIVISLLYYTYIAKILFANRLRKICFRSVSQENTYKQFILKNDNELMISHRNVRSLTVRTNMANSMSKAEIGNKVSDKFVEHYIVINR